MPEQRPAPDTRTLAEALRETAMRKWQGRRCYATNMSQAEQAIESLALDTGRGTRFLTVAEVQPWTIRAVTALWYAQGLAPATINKRLNCLSAMGVSVEGCRVREPKVLKWWLKPEDEERACAMLEASGDPEALAARTFIRWTTRTGLRVEETLRLRRSDFSRGMREVTVPGLKTADAQATLPLGIEAHELAYRAMSGLARDVRLVPLTYDELVSQWNLCREFLGVSDNPTATLKALRRSAARHLHITKGMPLDMVRQYLRHEDLETTLGYLRLTGGYGTEEMRKWL